MTALKRIKLCTSDSSGKNKAIELVSCEREQNCHLYQHKVTHLGFREDTVEGERKTIFPNYPLLNSMKQDGLLTGWISRASPMLKAPIRGPISQLCWPGSSQMEISPVPENSRPCEWAKVEEDQTVCSPTSKLLSWSHWQDCGEWHLLSIEKHLCPLSDHSVNLP